MLPHCSKPWKVVTNDLQIFIITIPLPDQILCLLCWVHSIAGKVQLKHEIRAMHEEKMAACTVMEHARSVLHLRAALETFLETANRTTNSKQRPHAFYNFFRPFCFSSLRKPLVMPGVRCVRVPQSFSLSG